MKFTISATELNAKLIALAKVMNSKVALPIYSTFLLELKDGVLRITASDMDCSRCSTLPVIDMDGANGHSESICVTASFLLDSLKNLGDQPVTFEADEENLLQQRPVRHGGISGKGLRPSWHNGEKREGHYRSICLE